MAIKAIPDGYHSVTPYLAVRDANRALAYYKEAFGATELMRFPGPDGKIGHAEIKIGNSTIMLADECPEGLCSGPQTLNGTTMGILLYVEDADTMFQKAVAAGAKVLRPLKDQFYGDRSGSLEDPFGHRWTIATHKEDVSMEEMNRRLQALSQQQAG
jgi:PhnB protein